MRVSETLDPLLESTCVTLVMCRLFDTLCRAALGWLLLFIDPDMRQRYRFVIVIRVRRAMMTIRRAPVRLVSIVVSEWVAELFMLVLILLNMSALMLLVPLRMIPYVSTMWSILLFDVTC